MVNLVGERNCVVGLTTLLFYGLATGSVVGWSLDRSRQLNTVFHHELKDPLTQLAFRLVHTADIQVSSHSWHLGQLSQLAFRSANTAIIQVSSHSWHSGQITQLSYKSAHTAGIQVS